ncbi:MAG: hypothetical protein Q8908_02035 [Bacteroidota bacterium]|nr:hypothetical protein [Bacteroidota bacterium]
MENHVYSGVDSKRLIKLLKDFTKGCISENIDAKAEIKPLAKSPKNPESFLNVMKYSKSPIK